eukprot:87844-Lingulodinium_polyedra.AAC.1
MPPSHHSVAVLARWRTARVVEGHSHCGVMAPKKITPVKKEADICKKTTIVKKEGDICISGTTGKALQNAVTYKLSQSPEEVRKLWQGTLRYDKTASSEAKREFIKPLLTTQD